MKKKSLQGGIPGFCLCYNIGWSSFFCHPSYGCHISHLGGYTDCHNLPSSRSEPKARKPALWSLNNQHHFPLKSLLRMPTQRYAICIFLFCFCFCLPWQIKQVNQVPWSLDQLINGILAVILCKTKCKISSSLYVLSLAHHRKGWSLNRG